MKGLTPMKKHILIAFVISVLFGPAPSGRAQEGRATPLSGEHGDDAVASMPVPSGPAGPALQRRDPRYRLQIGDALEINFPLTPEYNQSATIQPDGYINLRQLPDMHIAGLTTPELVEALKKAYATQLIDPEITVVLTAFEKPCFVAAGEFATPGKIELKGTTNFVQAVAMAGGIKEGGKYSQVILFRRVSNDWVEVKKLNLDKIARSRRLGEDLQIMPGDVLYVPRSTMGKIGKYIPTASMGILVDPFVL
jgi:polysaccharide export outer membrane protein